MCLRIGGYGVYRTTFVVGLLGAVLLQAGCLQRGQPLIAERSPVFTPPPLQSSGSSVRIYTVRKGDTLYSIAWRFDLDHRGFARANGIYPPYVIRPGKKLRLISQLPNNSRVRDTSQTATAKAPAVTEKRVLSDSSRQSSGKTPSARGPGASTIDQWVWPLAVKPEREFGKDSKGLDFRLPGGAGVTAKVRSAASGEVVYAGNGIGGFERLVIVKHSGQLLSAYSFDGGLLVAEKQQIKAGASIADIKPRGRVQPALHFELRKDGQPINPRTVLR